MAATTHGSVEVSTTHSPCGYIVLYYLQVRAEDADVLIMLIHHSSSTVVNHSSLPRRALIMSGESRNLSLMRDKSITCSFVMPSLVLTQFLPLLVMGKLLYSTGFVHAGDIAEHVKIFLDIRATKEAVVESGLSISIPCTMQVPI